MNVNNSNPEVIGKQRGVVLFIALIALVVIMLAAVALVRSVDTGNLIAGNVAFRRAATSSADSGLEAARTWLLTNDQANQATTPFTDPNHFFNVSQPANGYYSNEDPTLDVTAASFWTDVNTVKIGGTAAANAAVTSDIDAGGNTVRYIIQRMCRQANQILTDANCVFSDAENDNDSHDIPKPLAEKSGPSVMYRVTARVTGPRNTISFIQAFIY